MSTLKDVAELAGVSRGTVDRIIHNRGRFSEETASRVKDAMHVLNYKPDIRARNLSLSRKCRIAVIMPHPESNSEYWNLSYEGMHKALDELSASHVTAEFYHFDENDHEDFLNLVKKIKDNNYDAYVAAPLLHDEFLSFFNDIFHNKPVVFFDSDIDDSNRYSYIGQKSLEAGHLAAKLMNHFIVPQDKKILIITTDSHNIHLVERVNGFIERINNQTEVVELPVNKLKIKEALDEIEPKLGEIYGGVFIAYSSCQFAAELIESKGLGDKIPFVGFDLVPKNIEFLKRGTINYILTQRPVDQGYISIRTLYRKIILGQDIISEQLMPIDIITQENLASYLRVRDIL